MKKIIAIVLTITMLAGVISAFAVGASAATEEITPDTSWYTDAAYTENGNKYLLDDAADVLGFSNLLAGIGVDAPVNFDGKNVELTADVDLKYNTWGLLVGALNDDATRPESREALEFPVLQNYGFWGVFDGKGHTISGISFDGYVSDDVDAHDCTLFGIVPAGKTATVKNLAIANSAVEVSYFSGIIFSTIEGTATVDSVWLTSSTKLTGCGQSIGTVIGRIMPSGNATISNCLIECTHEDNWQKDRKRGGFVAESYGVLTIEDCAMYGKITKPAIDNGQNAISSQPAGIIQIVGKSATYDAADYAPSLTVKNVIICGQIATAMDENNASLDKVVYFMDTAKVNPDVTTDFDNLLYVNVTRKELMGVEGEEITIASIYGEAAAALLTEKGLTAWSTYDEGRVVPTTMFDLGFFANTSEDDTPTDEAPDNTGNTGNSGTTDDDQNDETTTQAPTTQAPAGTEKKSGCGSTVFGGVALLAMLSGAALTVTKKRK